jgi:probable rRNA maturation factor
MAPGDTGSSRSRARPAQSSSAQSSPAQSRPTRPLRVSVCDARGVPVTAPGLAAWLARVAPARIRGTVTIALISDARMRTLNRNWRRVDHATDVLSFPAVDTSVAGSAGAQERSSAIAHLGDIVIAKGVAARQARAAGHSEAAEWRVLALHGLLHLVGYDHEQDDGEMARVEARLRRRGGLAAGLIERAPRRAATRAAPTSVGATRRRRA